MNQYLITYIYHAYDLLLLSPSGPAHQRPPPLFSQSAHTRTVASLLASSIRSRHAFSVDVAPALWDALFASCRSSSSSSYGGSVRAAERERVDDAGLQTDTLSDRASFVGTVGALLRAPGSDECDETQRRLAAEARVVERVSNCTQNNTLLGFCSHCLFSPQAQKSLSRSNTSDVFLLCVTKKVNFLSQTSWLFPHAHHLFVLASVAFGHHSVLGQLQRLAWTDQALANTLRFAHCDGRPMSVKDIAQLFGVDVDGNDDDQDHDANEDGDGGDHSDDEEDADADVWRPQIAADDSTLSYRPPLSSVPWLSASTRRALADAHVNHSAMDRRGCGRGYGRGNGRHGSMDGGDERGSNHAYAAVALWQSLSDGSARAPLWRDCARPQLGLVSIAAAAASMLRASPSSASSSSSSATASSSLSVSSSSKSASSSLLMPSPAERRVLRESRLFAAATARVRSDESALAVASFRTGVLKFRPILHSRDL